MKMIRNCMICLLGSSVLGVTIALTVSLAAARAEDTSVHGRVMGQTAEGEHLGPVAGAKVEFKGAGTATTDSAGYYRIPLSLGSYDYHLTAEGYLEENAGRGFELTETGANVLDFVITKGSDKPEAPTPLGQLNARVMREGKNGNVPLGRATVTIRCEAGVAPLQGRTGPQGYHRFRVIPGSYRASASAEGYATSVHPSSLELLPDGSVDVLFVLKQQQPGDPSSPSSAPTPGTMPAPLASTTPPAGTPTNPSTSTTPSATPEPPNDGTMSSFYGSRAKAKRIAFVVDNSLTMGNGRLEKAVQELLASVRKLKDQQKFYVVFFSDTLHPMLEPDSPADMVAPDAGNIAKLESFTAKLKRNKGSNAIPALERVFELKPDLIYLLTDGAFTDRTRQYLHEMTDKSVPIHAIGFGAKDRGAANLQKIAEEHRGTYTPVQ